ncbi:MAG: glycosyltransferase family 39 protein [Chloroflexi bacterium]|nr:glycosyltransferase family 39 protein [Chloroflexota bacterium]
MKFDIFHLNDLRLVRSPSWSIFTALTLGIAGLILYGPILQAGFWTDDFVFVELAARRTFADYFAFYFDPRNLDLQWYRPMQGIQWWIEYQLLGTDATGYHIVNLIFHLLNCFLLSMLITQFTRDQVSGLVSALLFLSLPLISVAVHWPGVADVLMTLFYLTTLLFWVRYLKEGRRWIYALALIAFICTLLTKEMGATLIAVLFLADRLLVRKPASIRELVKRYLPLTLIMIFYAAIEYLISIRGVYVGQVAYRPSERVWANAWQYIQGLVVPWNLGEPWNQLAFFLFVVVILFLIVIKRQPTVIFLVAAGLIAVLPVLPFPYALNRYLYLPILATMTLFGLGFAIVRARIPTLLGRTLWLGVAVLFLIWNGMSVNEGAVNFANFIRDTRLQFRPIFQKHPAISSDTLFYFIDPPFPTPTISSMMFVRYGANAYAYGTDRGNVAGLRNHDAAYIYYRDDNQVWQEISVTNNLATRASTAIPARFTGGIQLDAYELAADTIKRNQTLGLIVYWRTVEPIAVNYTLFVHLVNAHGQVVAGLDSQPHQGNAPTSSWRVNYPLADGIVVPIDATVLPGSYSIELGWYNVDTGQRLSLVDEMGQPLDDKILIKPIQISE